MKELSKLNAPVGSNPERKRLGRGYGSGQHRTSGKGHKGRKARAGGTVSPYFEGGQMPINRRLPKRGFKNVLARVVVAINVSQLNRFEDQTVVDRELLLNSGLVKGRPDAIKCLGDGELERRLTVRLDAFSKSAIEKIEARQGKAEVASGK